MWILPSRPDSWGFSCGQPGQRQLLVPLNKFGFQPAISRWVLPAVFCCLAFDCRVLLSNIMMLTQIISERQMSDRLFTLRNNACTRCVRLPFSPRGVYPMSRILSFKLSNAARLSTSSNISIVGLAASSGTAVLPI